jgi:peptidyl-prolyl cis-trans isomerase SurA
LLFLLALLTMQHSFPAENQPKPETAPVRLPSGVKSLDKIIAVVNESVIMSSDLDNKIELIKKQMAQNSTPIPEYSILRKKVLDNLIDIELQLQVAKRAGIDVTQKELDTALSTIASRNNMSLTEFKAELERENIDLGSFSNQIRTQILLNKVSEQVLAKKISISEQDIKDYIKQHHLTEQDLKDKNKEIQETIFRSKFVEALHKWLQDLRESAYIKVLLK